MELKVNKLSFPLSLCPFYYYYYFFQRAGWKGVMVIYLIELIVNIFWQIHHLSVNALLKSNQVNEMEGGGFLGFDQDMNLGSHTCSGQYGFDESTASAPALRVLKQLIQRCLTDAVTSGNVFADALLQHLHRWLCRLVFLNTCHQFFFFTHIITSFNIVLQPPFETSWSSASSHATQGKFCSISVFH